MANEKYSQVTDLLAQGRLNWQTNLIDAALLKDATFDKDHKLLSEVGSPVARTSIQGRWVGPGGECMGYSVFFTAAEAEVPYQVVVIQDTGTGDPNVLAWYDTDESDGPLQMENTGTLVIRPQVPDTVQEGAPTESRVWMRV